MSQLFASGGQRIRRPTSVLPYEPAILLPGIYPQKTTTEKDTGTPVVHDNSQATELTVMSIDRQIDKEVVLHTHSGIPLSHKK